MEDSAAKPHRDDSHWRVAGLDSGSPGYSRVDGWCSGSATLAAEDDSAVKQDAKQEDVKSEVACSDSVFAPANSQAMPRSLASPPAVYRVGVCFSRFTVQIVLNTKARLPVGTATTCLNRNSLPSAAREEEVPSTAQNW